MAGTKVADTPGPAYLGGTYMPVSRAQLTDEEYVAWSNLPVLDYPGLYQLQGYASSREEAIQMYSYTHGGAAPEMGSSDYMARETIFWAGVVGGFSLAGFGVAAVAGLTSAGVAASTAVYAGIGTSLVGVGTTVAVETAGPDAWEGQYSSGALIGGLVNLGLQLSGSIADWLEPGAGVTAPPVAGSASGLSGEFSYWQFLRDTNPGAALLWDLLF